MLERTACVLLISISIAACAQRADVVSIDAGNVEEDAASDAQDDAQAVRGDAMVVQDGGEPVSAQYARAMHRVYCARIFACPAEINWYSRERVRYGTEDACVEDVVIRERFAADSLARALDDGTVTFSPEMAEKCEDMTRTRCRGSDAWPCNRVTNGTSGEGGGCRAHEECANGLMCNGGSSVACGTCKPVWGNKPLGAACTVSFECAADDISEIRCMPDAAAGHDTCQRLGVVRGVAAGERCGSMHERHAYFECAPGLYCQSRRYPETCRPLRALGESCSSRYDLCESGSSCERVNGEDRCRSIAWQSAVGDACDATHFCRTDLSLECDEAAGTCRARAFGDGSEGAKCLEDGHCGEGMFCSVDRCQAFFALGMYCGRHTECQSGFCARSSDLSSAWCAEPSEAVECR